VRTQLDATLLIGCCQGGHTSEKCPRACHLKIATKTTLPGEIGEIQTDCGFYGPSDLDGQSQECDNLRRVNGEFTIEYVELPNGRMPAREFVDSLDDRAAARIDAFIERLRVYGNRMQGKFVRKLTNDIFELRVKQFDRIFRVLFFY
jgi:hypothetical protein